MRVLNEAPISLRIPNDPAHLRIVRLLVASVAADLGFDFEDLRIAADEVVNLAMLAGDPAADIAVGVYMDGGVLSLRVSTLAGSAVAPVQLDPLATQIVAGIVDSYAIESNGGSVEAAFQSRPPARVQGV